MKTLNEQIANRCIYFNGLINKIYEAGIEYKSVEVPNARPIKIPCLKDSELSGGSCPKACFPSKEEVEKQTKELQEQGQRQMIAYTAVKEHIGKTGEMQGKIECTSCGGSLHYTAASSNGHIWAKCKCGLGWME